MIRKDGKASTVHCTFWSSSWTAAERSVVTWGHPDFGSPQVTKDPSARTAADASGLNLLHTPDYSRADPGLLSAPQSAHLTHLPCGHMVALICCTFRSWTLESCHHHGLALSLRAWRAATLERVCCNVCAAGLQVWAGRPLSQKLRRAD